ncbi:MAG: protein-export chaperone SecB [Bacteroidota bacterium]|nr:protein-export chaperone SecB [Bacteroidota bacterium]
MSKVNIQNTIKLVSLQVNKVNFENKRLFLFDDNKEVNQLDLNSSIKFSDDNKYSFTVEFTTLINNNSIHIEIIYIALFQCEKEITDVFKASPFVSLNAPAIAFPFLRSFITTLTANAGIDPIILPAINFAKVNTNPLNK